MRKMYFSELSRRLREKGIETSLADTQKLDILLRGRPVLFVSSSSDIFLLPAGSQNEETNGLYHQVAVVADAVYEYVEAMQGTPILHASGLNEEFHLLADFGGAVLAGRERENGQGYYYDAVLWAVANGVTNGTTATTFSPNAPVTRAQAVTFQWRTAGSPAVSGGSFSDVAASAYYSGAVAWAVAGGITNGTTATTFNPDTPVSRAQAVTFLWRELA